VRQKAHELMTRRHLISLMKKLVAIAFQPGYDRAAFVWGMRPDPANSRPQQDCA
jgi:hypothetical protein